LQATIKRDHVIGRHCVSRMQETMDHTGRHLLPLEATTRQTLQKADSSNIDEVENTPVTYYIDGDEGYSLTLTMIPWLG